MKTFKGVSSVYLLGLACLYFWATSSTCADSIPGLFNTGVDDSGARLPLHSVDPHYSVTGAATVAYVVPEVYNASLGWQWHGAPGGSKWIGPNTTDDRSHFDPVGLYDYALHFDLTGIDAASVRITGSWMTDNSAEIWLNGVYTGISKDQFGYYQPDPFSIQSGFIDGANTLDFKVINYDGPAGLDVANLSATYSVPEPSSPVLAGLIVLMRFLVSRRGFASRLR